MSSHRPPETPHVEARRLLQQLKTHAVPLRLLLAVAEVGIAGLLAAAPQTATELTRARRLDPGTLYRRLRSEVPGSVRERLLPLPDPATLTIAETRPAEA